MRTCVLVALSLVYACGSCSKEAPQEAETAEPSSEQPTESVEAGERPPEDGASDEESEDEASEDEASEDEASEDEESEDDASEDDASELDDVARGLPANASPETLAREIEARIRDDADLQSEDDARVTVALLESLRLESGSAHVFRVVLEIFTMVDQRIEYLIVAMPTEPEYDSDRVALQALKVGESREEPGAEDRTRVTGPTSLRAFGELVRMEFSTVNSAAEYATDGECQERLQSETVKTDYTVVCGDEACAAFATKVSIERPAVSLDCEGRPRRSGSNHMAEDTAPFEVSVAIDDGRVRLSRVSGSAPPSAEFSLEDAGPTAIEGERLFGGE